MSGGTILKTLPRRGLFHLPRGRLFRPVLEQLIGENADEHDRAHDGDVQRTGDIKQIHQILQHKQERGSDDDADDRAFATTQAASAQDRRRNSVKLIKISMRRGGKRSWCRTQTGFRKYPSTSRPEYSCWRRPSSCSRRKSAWPPRCDPPQAGNAPRWNDAVLGLVDGNGSLNRGQKFRHAGHSAARSGNARFEEPSVSKAQDQRHPPRLTERLWPDSQPHFSRGSRDSLRG